MDRLDSFIDSQHQTNTTLAAAMARMEQKLDDNSARLFGGPNQKGAITYLHEEHDKLVDEHKATVKSLGALISWKRGTLKWIAGAVFVLGAEGTALAFYFHNIATLIKAIPGHQ